MNRFQPSARLRAHARSAFLIVALSAVSLYTSGCDDSTPSCSGTECGGPTTGTPITPGDLPGSAIGVPSARCNAMGSTLTVLNDQILATDLATKAPPTMTFTAGQGFVVYFSVCNIGADSHAAVTSPPQGIHIAPSPGSPLTDPNNTTGFSIPALGSCECVNPIPQRQFAGGLPAGSYDINLIGLFSATPKLTLTIN